MWYKNIKNQLIYLPGEKAHLEMVPYRKLSSTYNLNKTNAKPSAVMCLLSKYQQKLYGLLIERQIDGGKHSGQIAFPGGKKDDQDDSLLQTALRETQEELGITSNQILVLGELTPVYIPISNFFVQPFLGVLNSKVNLTLSEREIKSAFFFEISELLNHNSKVFKDIKNHKSITLKNVPCFLLKDKTVWGATSLILNEIKEILINSKILDNHFVKK